MNISGIPTAPIDGSTIATDTGNPFEATFTQPIKLDGPRTPLDAHNLTDAVVAASLLTKPSEFGADTVAVFDTGHGFEAAHAVRATWGVPGYTKFGIEDQGFSVVRERLSHDLVALVEPDRWTSFRNGDIGADRAVAGPGSVHEATASMHGATIPLVAGGIDLKRGQHFQSSWSTDQVIEWLKNDREAPGAVALTRDTDGSLVSRNLTNLEDGPNRGERFHFAGHADEVSLAHVDDPNLIAVVDGHDVIRNPQEQS